MRAILIVLDSFGLGAARDADAFGDTGADTFGHIIEEAEAGKANTDGRSGPLDLPNLKKLGLFAAHDLYHGRTPKGGPFTGLYGVAQEMSKGKDTPSGHWEMAGVPVLFDWGYFPRTIPCFPEELTSALIEQGKLPGILGNCHASGTEIIERLGDEHMATGKPIVYTSADSVFQIAAHEESFGLGRLYKLCDLARELVDLAVPPPEKTLLDRLTDAGHLVISIGKIGDIFAHQGTGEVVKAAGNMALMDATMEAIDRAGDGSLIFTNLVDFDQAHGHRRNVAGYAKALEEFDARLPELIQKLRPGDIVILSADHGCDPTWPGTDHTREVVPVLAFGPEIKGRPIGERETFADIGQTIAAHLSQPPLRYGNAFLT